MNMHHLFCTIMQKLGKKEMDKRKTDRFIMDNYIFTP